MNRDGACAEETHCLIGILTGIGYAPSTMRTPGMERTAEATSNCPSLGELGVSLRSNMRALSSRTEVEIDSRDVRRGLDILSSFSPLPSAG